MIHFPYPTQWVCGRSCLHHHHGRLWSPLDVMKRFHAHIELAQVRMLEATLFRSRASPDAPIGNEHRAQRREIFQSALKACAEGELYASAASAEKILKILSKPKTPFKKLESLVAEFQER